MDKSEIKLDLETVAASDSLLVDQQTTYQAPLSFLMWDAEMQESLVRKYF